MQWFVRKEDADRKAISLEPVSPDLLDDAEAFPALDLDIAGRKRVYPLTRFSRFPLRQESDSAPVPCVHLDPSISRSTAQMGALWDNIALTDLEPEIIKAMKAVSEDIQAISMIGGDVRGARARTVIAKSARYPTPVPLKTFGDGVNRLFGIILSLCSARNGVLLVDEIENGLHYSIQTGIWRTIFRLAGDLNVQVFATSHSWDCIRAFQEAASESPENGMLVRLSKRGETVVPTLFSEDELKIVTRDQIEVR